MNRYKKEVEEHKNELVLDGFEVVRLESFKEDEEDNWYGLRKFNNEFYWVSCVIKLIFLKKFLTKEEYDSLNYGFNLNLQDRS